MKTLITYFSATNTTKSVAEKIAAEIKGDLFEIIPQQKYTEEDLNWNDKLSRSSKEMEDKTTRPKILNKIENLDNYDKVIIGFPVWWYLPPRIINTFIEENDLRGKNIYIFVTSGGTSSEGSFNALKEEYKDLEFITCKRFTGSEPTNAYNDWINN